MSQHFGRPIDKGKAFAFQEMKPGSLFHPDALSSGL